MAAPLLYEGASRAVLTAGFSTSLRFGRNDGVVVV